MKQKRFKTILPMMALLLVGCTADGGDGQQAPESDLVPVSISSTVMANGNGQTAANTRAASNLQTTQLAADEQFRVYFHSGIIDNTNTPLTNVVYTADGSGGTSSVSPKDPYFARTTSSATVSAYYGKSGGASGTAVGNTTTSFTVAADQTTDAAYQAADLMYAVATANKSYPAGLAALQFTHKMAKIVINANLEANITISAINIVSGYRTINIANPTTTDESTDAYLGALNTSQDAISGGAPLSMFSGTHSSGLLACAALLPPQTINAASSAAFLQVVTSTGTATFSVQNLVLASGSSYTFNIAVSAAAVGTTTQITNWVSDGSDILSNFGEETLGEKEDTAPSGVEAIDLGLSVKWANMNIGATSETDYGSYFLWGDPTDKSAATCSWATYKWNPSGDGTTMTKYNNTDGKTVLDLTDDMAYMNWGGKWRMPTYAEFVELLTLDKEWVADYHGTGVSGYTFTGNGNTIFLPAAGYRGSTSFSGQGSTGFYWSSRVGSSDLYRAWYFSFNSGTARMYGNNRSIGFSVREVQDK